MEEVSAVSKHECGGDCQLTDDHTQTTVGDADDNVQLLNVTPPQIGAKAKEEKGTTDAQLSNVTSKTGSEAAVGDIILSCVLPGEDRSDYNQDLAFVENGQNSAVISEVPTETGYNLDVLQQAGPPSSIQESETAIKDHVPETKLPQPVSDETPKGWVPQSTVESNVSSEKDDSALTLADCHTGDRSMIKVTVTKQAEINHQQEQVLSVTAGTTENLSQKSPIRHADSFHNEADKVAGEESISLQCLLDGSTELGDLTKSEGVAKHTLDLKNINPMGEVAVVRENGFFITTNFTTEDHLEEPDMDLGKAQKVIVREDKLVVSMSQITENYIDQHQMDIDHPVQVYGTRQETSVNNDAKPDSREQIRDDHIGKSDMLSQGLIIGENIVETRRQTTDDHITKQNMEIDIAEDVDGTTENGIEKSVMGMDSPAAIQEDVNKSDISVFQDNEYIAVEEDIVKAVCEVIEDRQLTGSRPVPVLVKGKEVNLLKLSNEVRACGGYDKTDIWSTIAKDLGFGLECGPVLKLVYLKYLKALENQNLIPNHDKKSANKVSKVENGDSKMLVTASSKKKKYPQSEDASAITVNADKISSVDSEALVIMLEWIKRLALNPGDPKRGQGTQKSKWNEARVAKCEVLVQKVRTLLSVEEKNVTDDHPSESVLKKRGRPKTPRRGSAKKNRLSSSS